MNASAPQPTEVLGRPEDLYELGADVQTATFRHMDALYPVRPVPRGASVHALHRRDNKPLVCALKSG